jgi:hypothetical protein
MLLDFDSTNKNPGDASLARITGSERVRRNVLSLRQRQEMVAVGFEPTTLGL